MVRWGAIVLGGLAAVLLLYLTILASRDAYTLGVPPAGSLLVFLLKGVVFCGVTALILTLVVKALDRRTE